jgi:hypothetical protein
MPDPRAIKPTPAAAPVERPALESAPAEHIYLSDDSGDEAGPQPKVISGRLVLRDRLRRNIARFTLYEEGYLRLDERRRGKPIRSHQLNLRYLDPVPSLEPYYPRRLLKIAVGCTAATMLAALLSLFDALSRFAIPATAAAGVATIIGFVLFVYMSHEKVVFRTLHGGAAALTLEVGLGYKRRFHAALPQIVRAIDNAAESIGDETAAFLRAEMREHYRLRGDGILTEEECSDSTGRILMHFDEEM